jgi:hypothetical protein
MNYEIKVFTIATAAVLFIVLLAFAVKWADKLMFAGC